ncbi:MAG: peptide chain release factor 1 [Candidatus Doudnabacteria bacterium]|nr:peptide chain release factor 1 [Candidatus Doudnabacteria bacterium]
MQPRFLKILNEFEENNRRLARPENAKDFAALGKRQREIEPMVEKLKESERLREKIAETKKLLDSPEAEIAELAGEELQYLETQLRPLERELEAMLTPNDPLDKNDVIVEIRAAAGGEESALFAAELFRMYAKFAETKNWRTHVISSSASDLRGFKEIISEIKGHNVYSLLKFESGVHRVQRVPATEKSGRVHTSTVTVAVLPIIAESEFKIDPKDLKIETSTSRGAGGQSVNTTYSAIKITHLPTGITASSQDERSQIQNRAKALEVITARVFAAEIEKKQKDLTAKRRALIGTGDRSEKIRTYNFPQDRVTDHRINQSFPQITAIINGKLDPITSALVAAALKLAKEDTYD